MTRTFFGITLISLARCASLSYKTSLMTGCGSVWLERSVRDAEAGGSNPLIPTRNSRTHGLLRESFFFIHMPTPNPLRP